MPRPARAGGHFEPLRRDRPVVASALVALQHVVTTLLLAQRMRLAAIARATRKAAGADDDAKEHELEAAAEALDYDALAPTVAEQLGHVAQDGAHAALLQVVPGNPDLHAMLAQANERAIAWAKEHAAELVKDVAETTRDRVRELTARALDEGWSNDELADAIEQDDAFSSARAERVARTETAQADVRGNLEGWRESGVVAGKRWVVADANECDACADLDGVVVGMDDDFPGDGGEGPPLHPNCRCDVVPVLSDDDG